VSTPESIVEAQTEALLRRVAREQETRCRRARDSAEEQARNIVARAWEEARARLRQAFEDERREVDQSLADRRAALETVARQRGQSVLRELMDEAWRELPAALEAVWALPESRRDWCTGACRMAARVLGTGAGIAAEFDAAAPDDAVQWLSATLGPGVADNVDIRRVPGLGPGLRIRRGRACLDATIPGLLASRDRIESELLAEMERLGDQRADE
jgi:hypothetical protein